MARARRCSLHMRSFSTYVLQIVVANEQKKTQRVTPLDQHSNIQAEAVARASTVQRFRVAARHAGKGSAARQPSATSRENIQKSIRRRRDREASPGDRAIHSDCRRTSAVTNRLQGRRISMWWIVVILIGCACRYWVRFCRTRIGTGSTTFDFFLQTAIIKKMTVHPNVVTVCGKYVGPLKCFDRQELK